MFFAIILKGRTALHHLSTQDDRVNRELNDISSIAENANRQLGYLISDFGAPITGAQDFRSMLHEAAGRIRKYYDIEVSCEGTGQADVPDRVRFALSRIVKEALNNVIRHAHCQHVTILYTLRQTEIILEIIDDGAGFDVEHELRRMDKYGLRNMQEYVRDLGGQMDLQSAPAQGTRVAVRVSLQTD